MKSDQLIIPDPAIEDGNSFEILRVWIAKGDQHISLRTNVWDDPGSWGIMLADLMRHIASSYYHEKGADIRVVLSRIRVAFEVEMATASDNNTSGK